MEVSMLAKLTQRLAALALVGSALALPGFVMSQAQAQTWACTAYEHRDYGGAWRGLAANGRTNRSKLGDKISSFRMVTGCRVIAYEHVDFKGPNAQWRTDVPYVGDSWNDLISSWECKCP
jgi:hypothetical protein